MFQILNEANPSGNGRLASDFDIFLASKFLVLEITDHKILAVWTGNIYADRFHTSPIRLDRIPRPSGILWSEFDFFGFRFSASYNKSMHGPLVCGVLGVKKCPLDMSQRHMSASFSTILEGDMLKTNRERQLFPISLSDSVFGEFSPQNLQFLQNEDSDLPRR